MAKRFAIGAAVASVMATAGLTGQSFASVRGSDTQPPTTPHLFGVHGLGGCELDMVIGLSKDNVTPQADIRYQLLSNGLLVPGQIVHAKSNGGQTGSLDVFVNPSRAPQSLRVRAIDQAGNVSQASNSISRSVTGSC